MNSYLIFNSRFVSEQGINRREILTSDRSMGQEKHMGSYESGCLFFTIHSDQHCFGSFTAKEVYISKNFADLLQSKSARSDEAVSLVNFKLVYTRFQLCSGMVLCLLQAGEFM